MSGIGDLERVLPGLRAQRPERSRRVDWAEYARALGTDVPGDYKELSEAYPTFTVGGFLIVGTPRPGNEEASARAKLDALDVLEDLAEDDMAGGYVPYPRPGGLLHCAETSSGDLFYWRTGGADPDSWPVVVSTRNDDWWEYDKGLVSLLAGLISGDVTPRGLPDPFLGDDRTVRVA
ncbi:SMI1/KNR4 family protein [Streptomyces sp. NPDC048109]|uniref:SMI1/KNR4 family protein n=1 Tax=unclassified Streptomyces TaxID=2593676 RepID=UPI0034023D45